MKILMHLSETGNWEKRYFTIERNTGQVVSSRGVRRKVKTQPGASRAL